VKLAIFIMLPSLLCWAWHKGRDFERGGWPESFSETMQRIERQRGKVERL